MAFLVNMILVLAILSVSWMGRLKTRYKLLGVIFCLVLFIFLIKDLEKDFQVFYNFIQTQCRIIDKDITTQKSFYIPVYTPHFLTEYSVNERPTAHSTKYDITNYSSFSSNDVQLIINSFERGMTYPCWYARDDYTNIVLAQNWSNLFYSWKLAILNCLVLILLLIKSGSK